MPLPRALLTGLLLAGGLLLAAPARADVVPLPDPGCRCAATPAPRALVLPLGLVGLALVGARRRAYQG